MAVCKCLKYLSFIGVEVCRTQSTAQDLKLVNSCSRICGVVVTDPTADSEGGREIPGKVCASQSVQNWLATASPRALANHLLYSRLVNIVAEKQSPTVVVNFWPNPKPINRQSPQPSAKAEAHVKVLKFQSISSNLITSYDPYILLTSALLIMTPQHCVAVSLVCLKQLVRFR